MVATQQRLGALLVDMGFIDDAQLASALEEQQRSDKRLGKILVEASILSEDRLVHALSRQLGIEACDPIMTRVHERVLSLIPPSIAFKHRVLPVARQREAERRDVVYVATADPLDQEALRVVSETLGDEARVQWMLAGETEMELALARHYGRSVPQGTKVITGVPVAGPPRSPENEEGSRELLSSTDDVFVALNESSSDGATTQPDRRLPPVELDLRSASPIAPSAEPTALPLSAMTDTSTEEILIAEEIVSEGDGGLIPLVNGDVGGHEDETYSGGPAPIGPPMSRTELSKSAPAIIDALDNSLESALEEEPLPLTPGEPRSDDITAELLPVDDGPVLLVETADRLSDRPPPFDSASWSDLLTSDDPSGSRPDADLGIDVTEMSHAAIEEAALAALAEAVETLPVASVSMSHRAAADEGSTVHPALPFPPLDGYPEIEEPDIDARVDLDALVARLDQPGSPAAPSKLPLPVSAEEMAENLHQEIQYFVSGGALDLTSQQRILRALTAIMMQEGLLSPERLRAVVKNWANEQLTEE